MLLADKLLNSRLAPRAPLLASDGAPPVEWVVTPGLTEYADALAVMEARAEAIARGEAPERVWLIEHPPLYTAGTSGKAGDLLEARFPVHRAGRGGQFTYHGPGQRIAYVMLDLKRRRPDVRAYVASLEAWLIETLKAFGVVGETREARVGVWVRRPDKPASPSGETAEDKIAAIGVRVRRWATLHGVALNVDPDLAHFSGIVPCGVAEAHYGVTSLADLGRPANSRAGRRGVARGVRAGVRPDRRSGSRSAAPVAPIARGNYSRDMGLQFGLPDPSRRAFWARLYARRRLAGAFAAPLAPAHYARIGERLGYRPNAFFDPAAFGARAGAGGAGRTLLERYLARPEPNAPSPSAEFDHGWYAAQNPDWATSHPHPFLHFLERGLREGRRPRPDIDLAFVRDITRGVKPRTLEEAAFRVFDRTPREGEMGPPLNRQELRARQDRFYADARMRIERERAQERDLLVFVQCGEGFDAAYLDKPRSYDVLLNCYREGAVNPKADIAVVQAGTKTTAVRRLMELRPDLLLRYRAVLFLDDDVEIGAEGIEALFRVMAAEKLDLAQPALTAIRPPPIRSSNGRQPAPA